MTKAGLYVHFPFCRAKCPYCHFLSVPYDRGLVSDWLAGVAAELGRAGGPAAGLLFDTLYIGGGTPSLLSPDEVARVRDLAAGKLALRLSEFSLEANPGPLDGAYLLGWKEAGVTRLSIGVQSFDDRVLKKLGRGYGSDEAADFCERAGRIGFGRVSFDLMIGVPGQDRRSLDATVDRLIGLAPDHVSVYILENVEGLPFEKVLAAEPQDDDAVADDYLHIRDRLGAAGLAQYEISNFSRPGAECRHNLKYWRYESFLGIGPSAGSHIADRRWSNLGDVRSWLEALGRGDDIREDLTLLSSEDQAREAFIFGLRLAEGVSPAAIGARFGVDINAMFGRAVETLMGEGSLRMEDGRLKLDPDSFLVSNQIFVNFIR